MNALWDFYWPAVVAAAIIGVACGVIALRPSRPAKRITHGPRRKRIVAIVAGIVAVLAVASLWHGPFGASSRFATSVERHSRETLVAFEMAPIQARIERDPLRRTLVLAGQADAFQRDELVRILEDLPGVGQVRWADGPRVSALPLLVEIDLAALAAFGFGLLLSYLLELRRRARAEWRW